MKKTFDPRIKVGMKLRIIRMDDPYARYAGKEGTVTYIDDIGQIHGTWGGCALIPFMDKYEIIEN